MAVQLRNRLTRGLSLAKPLPATVMFDYPTIEKLAGEAPVDAGRSCRTRGSGPAPYRANRAVAISAAAVARMSEAEIETMLAVRGRR